MFGLREVQESDIDDLFELSKLQTFINLPADKDDLIKKIKLSKRSFSRPCKNKEDNMYIFVLEDLEKQKVIGSSNIHGKHGTKDVPHFFLKVSHEHKYSKTLNTGFIHGTLKLGIETDGYTEIGGLVLHPDYRRNSYKLGKQLSFIRFFYMALYPQRFTEYIHTELMPPLDEKGCSPLWEAIGKRFLKIEYKVADRLSRQNKEFILGLFPKGTIYTTLLSSEARNVIGRVGKTTLPVVKMLESVGFSYTEEVDPFDGGPHYRAKRSEIIPIKNFSHDLIPSKKDNLLEDHTHLTLLQVSESSPLFQAFCVKGVIDESSNKMFLDKKTMEELNLTDKQKVNGVYL